MSRTYRRKGYDICRRGYYGRGMGFLGPDIVDREKWEADVEYLESQVWNVGHKYVAWNGNVVEWWSRCPVAYVTFHSDYDHYVADTIARRHKDGHQWPSHWKGFYSVPRAFVNSFCNRPLRNNHKQEIAYRLSRYEEDMVMLEPFVHNARRDYY